MTVRRVFVVLGFAPLAARSAISAASSPVVVDMVVRDKRGDPLADLRAGEVHFYEDGVEQAISDFRRVTLQHRAATQPGGEFAEAALVSNRSSLLVGLERALRIEPRTC